MPGLNDLYSQFCESNQILLNDRGLINDGPVIDLERRSLEEQKQIINELIDNEKLNADVKKEDYIKAKYIAKLIVLFLTSALALIVAGVALAPLLIATSVIIPMVPILSLGIAIIAFTWIFLNIKNNRLGTEATQAADSLNQLKEYKVEKNVDETVISVNNINQHTNSQIGKVTHQIADLNKNIFQEFDGFRRLSGIFSSKIPVDDFANESDNLEKNPILKFN